MTPTTKETDLAYTMWRAAKRLRRISPEHPGYQYSQDIARMLEKGINRNRVYPWAERDDK